MEPIEALTVIAQFLIILVLLMLPYILLAIGMIFGLQDFPWKMLKAFALIFLPGIVLIIGVIVGLENFDVNILNLPGMWFYIIPVTWFGSGIVFFGALYENTH
jgi:hypothetical protein